MKRLDLARAASLDAEYYRLDSKGHRVYNGYREWGTFLGINHIRLAARWKHFKARPGRYVAVLRATDEIEQHLEAGDQGLHDPRPLTALTAGSAHSPRDRERVQRRRYAAAAAAAVRFARVAEGLLGRLFGLLAHRDLEHRQQGVGGKRPQRLERLEHLRASPPRGGPPCRRAPRSAR